MPSTNDFVHALAVATAVVVPSYRVRYLTFDGAIAAMVVGTVIFTAGWTRALQLLIFFFLGSISSKWKRREKAALAPYQPEPIDASSSSSPSKRSAQSPRSPRPPRESPRSPPPSASPSSSSSSSTHASHAKRAAAVPKRKKSNEMDEPQHERHGRNAMQVLATAGVPTLMCACSMVPWWADLAPWLSLSYFVFMCVNLADTLASELGMLSKQTPRLITSWTMHVAPGVDGGVTFLGTNASLLGGALMGLCEDDWWNMCLMGALWGIIGSACDSLLGVLIQSRPQPVSADSTSSLARHRLSTANGKTSSSVPVAPATTATATTTTPVNVDFVPSPMSYERWQITNSLVNFLSCALTCVLACLQTWLERVDDGAMSLTPVLILLAVLLWLQSASLRDNVISSLAWLAFVVWACSCISSVVHLVGGALLMLQLHMAPPPVSDDEEEEDDDDGAGRDVEYDDGQRGGGAAFNDAYDDDEFELYEKTSSRRAFDDDDEEEYEDGGLCSFDRGGYDTTAAAARSSSSSFRARAGNPANGASAAFDSARRRHTSPAF